MVMDFTLPGLLTNSGCNLNRVGAAQLVRKMTTRETVVIIEIFLPVVLLMDSPLIKTDSFLICPDFACVDFQLKPR